MVIGKGRALESDDAIGWQYQHDQKVTMMDNYQSFAEFLRPKLALASHPVIDLNGCNTARTNWATYFTHDGENIALQLSRELPDAIIIGNRGYAIGTEWNGFLWTKEHHVWGIKRTYVAGAPGLPDWTNGVGTSK
jgi:hypothetical protein